MMFTLLLSLSTSFAQEANACQSPQANAAYLAGFEAQKSRKTTKALSDYKECLRIEDSCDALGSEFNGQNVGTFGDFGTLSFYPAHHITMGEGGALFTNNIKLKKNIIYTLLHFFCNKNIVRTFYF